MKCKGEKKNSDCVPHSSMRSVLCEYISGIYIFIFIPEMEMKKWSSSYLDVTEGAVVKSILSVFERKK